MADETADASADHIEFTGDQGGAASAYDVEGLLVDTTRGALAEIDALGAGPPPPRRIERSHLLAYCKTPVAVDGDDVQPWAALSGVYPALGGRRIQVHANFPHHAAGVVRRLGCEATRESVAAAIARRDAFELEAELIADGMVAAAVRTPEEWDAHPHCAATRDLPTSTVERVGDAPARAEPAAAPAADGPLAGLRVIDCSRVLAGPVAGQLLADHGAHVLRVGADHLASVPICVLATGFGKRSASVDLRTEAGRAEMDRLLESADVWIDAFRPGALARFGYTPEAVARRRPGIVTVQISAFGWAGPWAGRRGYDSIVQSTTGVRWAGGSLSSSDAPVGLPVQALDYATGFIAAGLAARLVRRQRASGGSWLARVSLLAVRDALVRRAPAARFRPAPVAVDPKYLVETKSAFGRLRTVAPFSGRSRGAPVRLGSSPAEWW